MEDAGGDLELGPLFMRWARDSARARGVRKSLVYLVSQLWSLLRDSFPERRRSRFGDIDYDCDNGFDTTWACLSWDIRLREVLTERLYQPTVPEEFSSIFQQLARVDFTEFTFIDLGSGKGRALLLAADYPFRSILGVEIQPELHAIAERNLEKLREEKLRQKNCIVNVQSICLDAREFCFPLGPLIVYLFNPFPDYVLAAVVANLEKSLRCNPRPAYVIYNAPFEHQVIERAKYLRRIVHNPQYEIYEANV